MKLVTFEKDGRERTGVVVDDRFVIDIHASAPSLPPDMTGLIAAWPSAEGAVRALRTTGTGIPLSEVRLRAPVPRPGKILAIGLNYADHIAETGRPAPEHQLWFSKMQSAVNGPYDPIQIPRASTQVDYEAEFVVVIGRRCRHVTKQEAADAVFGYAAGNDVSVRDWQFRTGQYVLGKSFDTHAPFGPWIVTTDEIGDPHNLGIRCFVNGAKRQDSNTRHLVFDVFDQIAHLSEAMTLEPGDVIYTGTPGGVGFAAQPPEFLKAGDVVRVEIDRIGALEARLVPEP
ncbi:MAG TPA: fumarylacetoacetate hydrolase family protein [Rhizomicrobium sp.]|nr:fumarylacetoacetate hydrolase family protein [Rhizomicrobium sp.]